MSSNKFESKVNKSVDDSDPISESDIDSSSLDSSSDNPKIVCQVISKIPNKSFDQIMNGNKRKNKKYRNPAPKDCLDQILKNIEELTKNVDYKNKSKIVIDSDNNSILSRKKLNLDQFESEIMKNLSNKIIENIEDLNNKREEFIETINKLNEQIEKPNEKSKEISSLDSFEEFSEDNQEDNQEVNQEINEPETINDEKLIQVSNEIIANCKNKLRNYQYFFVGCLLVLILVSIFNSTH